MFKRVNVIVYDMVMLKSMDPHYKSRTDYHLFLNVSYKEYQNSVLQLKFHTTFKVVKYYR